MTTTTYREIDFPDITFPIQDDENWLDNLVNAVGTHYNLKMVVRGFREGCLQLTEHPQTMTLRECLNADVNDLLTINIEPLTLAQVTKLKAKGQTKRTLKELNCYSDACSILGEVEVINPEPEAELKMIIRAANFIDNGNKECILDFSNPKTRKYIPYLERTASGWVLDDVVGSGSRSYCPVWLYYLKESTADLFVKRFLPLYNKVMG